MDASEVQRSKAHSPIDLTLKGMLIEMSDVQSRKAMNPILNVPSGMMTSPFSFGGKAHPASASLMRTAITKTHAASWQVRPRCLAGIMCTAVPLLPWPCASLFVHASRPTACEQAPFCPYRS